MNSSLFRYPGGKAKLRDIIINKLSTYTQYQQYREPFLGGGSITLKLLHTKPHIKRIWINDKDTGISSLWTSIIRYPKEFKDKIEKFVPDIPSFLEFKKELININKTESKNEIVDIGFKKLAIHQISYSGLGTKSGGPLGGIEQKSKYKINCRWSPNYLCSKVDEIHKLLHSIEIYQDSCTNLDFNELITDQKQQSLLYLDPPYYVKGNDLYQHGFTNQDHQRLSDSLIKTKHNWVLSYDDCQQIRERYTWAKTDTINVNYTITQSKVANKKTELLIYCHD